MVSKDVGRVPVKDKNGKLLGIVDREDVARLVVK
jgi:CBS domain-containing protein